MRIYYFKAMSRLTASIITTMNYYVGIRESLIDRARDANSAALEEDFSALFVCAAQNSENGSKETVPKISQPFVLTEVKQTCSDNT